MTANIGEILAHGHAYLYLFIYFVLAMLIEAAYDNVAFNRWLARLSALVLVAFIGLRWETGTDWKAYFNIFYATSSNPDYDIIVYGIDPGYLMLGNFVRNFSYDYTSFLVVNSALAIFAVYYFVEKSTKLPNMGMYIFYTSYMVTHFMGSNRRMLAIGLVCVGFLFLLREGRLFRGWPRWAVPFSIAATFHRTSIMALPGLVVSRRAWPAPFVVLGLIACVGLGISGLPFDALEALGNFLSRYLQITVVDKLLFYTSGPESQAAANFDVMGQALLGVVKRSTVLVIFVTYMILGKPTEYTQRLYNIYVLGCAIYFLMIGSPVFQVVSTYYTIVEIALIPIIFSNVPQFKVPYILYLLVVPTLLLLSALSPFVELYVPYRSIFTTY